MAHMGRKKPAKWLSYLAGSHTEFPTCAKGRAEEEATALLFHTLPGPPHACGQSGDVPTRGGIPPGWFGVVFSLAPVSHTAHLSTGVHSPTF